MSTTTSNLGLFKYDTTNPTDLASAFNINQALNNNWDIIDNAITHVDGLPDQTDKAGYLLTTDGTEASWGETEEIQCVVETYQNGTSWYRIYSDGWCEQGGVTTASSSATKTVTLLQNYRDTTYTVVLGSSYSATTTFTSIVHLNTKSVGSFQIIDSTNTTVLTYWQTSGYLEV